jgi:hypothetical protein
MSEEQFKLFISVIISDNYDLIGEHTNDKNYIRKLYASCRSNDKKKFGIENIITKEEIEDLIDEQDNKCAITGIPLINTAQKYFPFKPSVDRINNDKGHIKDNCQIVCLAIQYGKLQRTNQEIKDYIEEIKEANKEDNKN